MKNPTPSFPQVRQRAKRIGLLAALCSTVACLCAQPVAAPHLVQSRVVNESQQTVEETVRTALRDLTEGDTEARRGSVMLLAKYPQHPIALTVIADALQDPEPTVRRAAAVSLAENIQMLGSQLANRLLVAIEDSDPEVRLTVSTWLPQLLMMGQNRFFPGTSALAAQQNNPPVERLLLQALEDDNPLIRINVLDSLRYLRTFRADPRLMARLADDDARVRVAAWQVFSSLIPDDELTRQARQHIEDPDSRVRMAMMEVLLERRVPDRIDIFTALIDDPTEAVRLHAQIGVFMLQRERQLPEELVGALNDNRITGTLLFRLFNHIRSMDNKAARRVTEPLLELQAPNPRSQAASVWLHTFDRPPPVEPFIRLLNDTAPEVRQQVQLFVIGRNLPLLPEVLAALPEVPFDDIRLNAFSLAMHNSSDERAALALAMLMDNQPRVRLLALQQIQSLRPPQWQRVFMASLRDPSPLIQQQAVQALLRQMGPDGREVALRFAEQNPDHPSSRLIRNQTGQRR